MSIPRTPIQAPTLRPPRYSLLGIAETVTVPDEVWGAGYVFDPEARPNPDGEDADMYGTEILYGWVDDNPASGDVCDVAYTIDPDREGLRTAVTGYPFLVWAADRCSTFGHQARDWQGRAQRLLRSVESCQVAKMLWDGEGTELCPSLSELATVTDVNVGVAEAIGRLEKAVAVTSAGAAAMFHMSPFLLSQAVTAEVLWRDGAVWRTPMGHTVVADAGYSGIGPTDATYETVLATPMIGVALSPVEMVPGTFQQAIDWAQALDRATNTVLIRAQRQALLVWDPSYVLGITTNVSLAPSAPY